MISGIDLSDKNGKVDWLLLKGGEVSFVYLKATEAIDSVDAYFQENMRQARNLGIPAGAYHWLHPGIHVGQQADLFVKTVKDFKGLLPPVVCLETYQAPLKEIEKNTHAFLTLIEKKSGMRPIIYTSDSYWKTNYPQADWGCDYRLWIDKPGTTWPPQLWPWAGWTIWQYAHQARLPGIPLNAGINWFNGTREELQGLAA